MVKYSKNNSYEYFEYRKKTKKWVFLQRGYRSIN
jgi:hypothetical protein